MRTRLIIAALLIMLLGAADAVARAAVTTHTTVSCANTSTEALAANSGRIAALFVNDSIQTIWIMIGATAVANEGIRLNANGGSYYMAGVDLDRVVVNCIVASGTGTILLTERHR